MTEQMTLDELWPEEMAYCEIHEWYDPEACYETVTQWLEDGCPICRFEVVGYEI